MKLPSLKHHPSFSLAEVLIAMTLFTMIATVGIIMISDVSAASQKVQMEEYLYTEGQALIERMGQMIQNSAIDYEEYYSRHVIEADPTSSGYGLNYGSYHEEFFNPSSSYETGKNPYDGSPALEETANALCEGGTLCSTTIEYHQSNQLYLINAEGSQKQIIALERGTEGYAISFVEMEGEDSDGNGYYDTWWCNSDFVCNYDETSGPLYTDDDSREYYSPNPDDLTDSDIDDNNFLRISPKNMMIDNLTFYISPIEDPFKGYDETAITPVSLFESVQIHPRVTIVLDAHYQFYTEDGTPLDFDESSRLLGAPPSITIQTTFGTGIHNEIPAYTP